MGKRAAPAVEVHLDSPNKRMKYDAPVPHSPVQEQTFVLNKEIVDGAIMTDINKSKWRVGKPFGKLFSATLFFVIIQINAKEKKTKTTSHLIFFVPYQEKEVLVKFFWLPIMSSGP